MIESADVVPPFSSGDAAVWLTETPWPPIFLALAGIALLASARLRSKNPKLLFGMIGLGAACIGIYVFERWYVTEPEKVEQAVFQLAEAVDSDDPDRTVGFIADDQLILRTAVRGGMAMVRIEDGIRVTDVKCRYAENGRSILSTFRANGLVVMKRTDGKQHVPTMWELEWKKSGENWRIVRIQRLNPLDGEPIGLLDPQ